MEMLLNFVKILGLGVLILLLLVIAFAIIEGTINYFRTKSIKREYNENMESLFEELLEEIAKEEEKKPRKPRKTKKEQ